MWVAAFTIRHLKQLRPKSTCKTSDLKAGVTAWFSLLSVCAKNESYISRTVHTSRVAC